MGNLCPYWAGRLPIFGVDAGFAGDRAGQWSSNIYLGRGRDSPGGRSAQTWRRTRSPYVQPRCPIGWPAREVTRTITRPIRKEHFGLSVRRVPFSP
jgi:hypothetical protein